LPNFLGLNEKNSIQFSGEIKPSYLIYCISFEGKPEDLLVECYKKHKNKLANTKKLAKIAYQILPYITKKNTTALMNRSEM